MSTTTYFEIQEPTRTPRANLYYSPNGEPREDIVASALQSSKLLNIHEFLRLGGINESDLIVPSELLFASYRYKDALILIDDDIIQQFGYSGEMRVQRDHFNDLLEANSNDVTAIRMTYPEYMRYLADHNLKPARKYGNRSKFTFIDSFGLQFLLAQSGTRVGKQTCKFLIRVFNLFMDMTRYHLHFHARATEKQLREGMNKYRAAAFDRAIVPSRREKIQEFWISHVPNSKVYYVNRGTPSYLQTAIRKRRTNYPGLRVIHRLRRVPNGFYLLHHLRSETNVSTRANRIELCEDQSEDWLLATIDSIFARRLS